MGEVHRARYSRGKRDVALKVLPADLASDPAGLERFQREAEAVVGLSHPTSSGVAPISWVGFN